MRRLEDKVTRGQARRRGGGGGLYIRQKYEAIAIDNTLGINNSLLLNFAILAISIKSSPTTLEHENEKYQSHGLLHKPCISPFSS